MPPYKTEYFIFHNYISVYNDSNIKHLGPTKLHKVIIICLCDDEGQDSRTASRVNIFIPPLFISCSR